VQEGPKACVIRRKTNGLGKAATETVITGFRFNGVDPALSLDIAGTLCATSWVDGARSLSGDGRGDPLSVAAPA